MMRTFVLSLALAGSLLLGGVRPAAQALAQTRSPPGEQQILNQRVAVGPGVGIVVAVAAPDGVTVRTAGSTGSGVPLDEHTAFEIGSVTKTFTATILASMVRDGTVGLDDRVAKYVPASVHVPSRNGKEITLLNLATQHSGLPRLPSNIAPEISDPYAHYGTAELYAFLNGYTLTRDPGAEFEYSNLGMGLLGVALANAAHTTYPELLRARVLAPLGMTETIVALTGTPRTRMAAPHTAEGDPANTWSFDALAPAGAIVSTAADMVKYVRCNMGQGPLAESCLFAQQPRDTIPGNRIGLAWWIGNTRGIIHHGGDTLGYHAAVAIAPDHTKGVVVLANGGLPVEDVAVHALDPSVPVAQAEPLERNDPALLEQYVGTYEHASGVRYAVTRREGQLFAQITGQEAVRVYAAGRDRFVYHVVKAQLDFTRDAQGRVNAAVLNQNGRTTVFMRPGMAAPAVVPTAAPEAAPATAPPVVQLDPATLDAYPGTYVTASGIMFTVRRAGDGIEVRLSSQDFYPVYASAKDRFFYKVVDAQLEFRRNGAGAVTELVLHQNGGTLVASRR